MNHTGFATSQKLIFDIKGLIVELKTLYFAEKNAFNDDQILVQKLCVQLEKLLRYGLKEKYTFLGVRKDYWNFICDCIPKDETVRFIQSISEFKTNQGKGRAFIRQALMEKTLADTLQRCVIKERILKEFYVVDSIFRHAQHFQNLIHLMYDLNAIDFNLPYKGYDLDRSWPAFARKTFNEENRKDSNASTFKEQRVGEGDPLEVLNTIIEGLRKTTCSWKGQEYTPVELDTEKNPLTFKTIIEQLLVINEEVISVKTENQTEITALKNSHDTLKEEIKKIKVESESQVKRIHDRYVMLQQTDKSTEQLKEAFDKLMVTEVELNTLKKELDLMTEQKMAVENNLNRQQQAFDEEKSLRFKDAEMITKLKGDLENNKKIANDVENCSVQDLKLFIKNVVELINDVDENNENFDEDGEPLCSQDFEDGLFKKTNKKKEQDADINVTEEEQRKALLMKLVELRKEIVVSRQEKGDFEKKVIDLKYEVEAQLVNENQPIDVKNNQEINQLSAGGTDSVTIDEEANSPQVSNEELQKQNNELIEKCHEYLENRNKLGTEIENFNAQIFEMSIDITKLNQELSDKNKLITKLEGDLIMFTELSSDNFQLKEKIVQMESELIGSEKFAEKLKLDIENLNSIKSNELKTMKFEISTIEMKYEAVLKELSDYKSKHEELTEEISVKEENVKLMESRQNENNTNWKEEKENLLNEKKELEAKLVTTKETYQVAEKEIKFLKIEISKFAADKENEKQARLNFSNRINNLIEERKSIEAKFKDDWKFLEDENSEIKEHMVNLTKDKHDLWYKKEVLEVELQSKSIERWVDDAEVKKCNSCAETFSLTLRKHHCRLCGQIFCQACSNRWIRTHHSKKRVRSCNVCADSYQELHKESGGVDIVDGTLNDMSDRSSVIGTDEFDESNDFDSIISSENLLTDAFEILDPANVSVSGSFGPSEEIKIMQSDIVRAPIIPTVQKGDQSIDDMNEKENLELTVTAGQRYLVPIVIGSSQFELIWEFTSSPKDIGFGLGSKSNEEENDSLIQTIIPLSRYISHKQTIHGKMLIMKPGLYYLMFDNSYSRFTTKSVFCTFTLARSKE